MKLFRRILVTATLTLLVIFTVVRWGMNVALTHWAVRKTPPVAWVVPVDLSDRRISQESGRRLSYLGCVFEVPWNDLDESKTELYPKDKPLKTMVILTFRSGLRLSMTAFPVGEPAKLFAADFKLSPGQFEQFVGHEAAKSDYVFWRNLYEFTPDKMHSWSWSSAVHAHELIELMLKSIAPAKSAETGIFNIQKDAFRGFQQGNPQAHPDRLLITFIRRTATWRSRCGRIATVSRSPSPTLTA